MSARQRCERRRRRRPSRWPRGRDSVRPGSSRASALRRASAALARWLSSVTMTTRIARRAPRQRPKCALASYSVSTVMVARRARAAKRSVLRRALPRTKNGIFCSSFSASAAQPATIGARSAALRRLRRCARRPAPRAAAPRPAPAVARQVRGRGAVVELEVVAEHVEQVLLEPHHQRMDPGVEDDVGAFEAHLRRVARREVLHVHRRRDHRAGDAQPLGDVALHLRAEHQLGLQLGDLRLDLEVVVGDQRLDAVARPRRRARRARTRGCRCRGRRP